MNRKLFIIETSCGNLDEARALARILVEGRYAACCHILPMTSCYRWKGNIEESAEVLLRCKATKERKEEAIRCIRAHHSYELPEIIIFSVESGDDAYKEWVERNSGKEKE
jgi:periplasmic divalent cation tolerance protein